MKIAILHGPRDLRIEDHPDPPGPGPGEVRVRTRITGFKIGTDRGNYEGAEDVPGAPHYPRWVGDSNLGVIDALGDDVAHFRIGDRVVSRHHHQSVCVLPATSALAKVPDSVHDEDAVFAYLYSLSAYCFHKALFRPGESVAIVGLGTLGLGAVAVGPLLGARTIAVGNDDGRIAMAVQMGAHFGVRSDDPESRAKVKAFSGQDGVDLVILTANPWPAYETALELVRENGRMAIVSLLGRGEEALDFNPLSMDRFFIKGISLYAASGLDADFFPVSGVSQQGRHGHCHHVLALMAEGRLEPKRLVTHRFPFTQMVEAYEMALRREKGMMNVVFDWRGA